MSQGERQSELCQRAEQLLQGPLKHVRAAALAAVLVPLASVAVTPALAQDGGSGGTPTTGAVPAPCDFLTSGGFVLTDSGQEANFGAHGGCKNGGFWGHLNFVDHGTGYHIDSLEVTGYVTPTPGSNIRDICGVATTNAAEGQPVWFRVRLVDNGEPGIADIFGIRLSTGYAVTSRLLGRTGPRGGNVQLHDPNPSTVGPTPSPDEQAMCAGIAAP